MSHTTCGHPTRNGRECQRAPSSRGGKYCEQHRNKWQEQRTKVQWDNTTRGSPPQSIPTFSAAPTKGLAWSLQSPSVESVPGTPGRELQPVQEFLQGNYCQCPEPHPGKGQDNDTCQRSKSESEVCRGCDTNTLLLGLHVKNTSKRICIPMLVRTCLLLRLIYLLIYIHRYVQKMHNPAPGIIWGFFGAVRGTM